MKTLLLQLDSDRHPSAFDRIVGYDAGADEVLGYGGVQAGDVRDLVHGAIFTRGPKVLKNTAIFVGGSDLGVGEEILERVKEAFFGPLRVSVMLDSNGSNTTAVAAVAKLEGAAVGLKGKRALVVAGTGPVGRRAAGLFARAGADVTITSRSQGAADRAREAIERRFECSISARVASYPLGPGSLLQDADIVLAGGPPGARLIESAAWSEGGGPSVLGDANAVPPLGIEGVEPGDDGEQKNRVTVFGALGIGGFKMKLHKACIARLFSANDLILDAEAIYDVARSL